MVNTQYLTVDNSDIDRTGAAAFVGLHWTTVLTGAIISSRWTGVIYIVAGTTVTVTRRLWKMNSRVRKLNSSLGCLTGARASFSSICRPG